MKKRRALTYSTRYQPPKLKQRFTRKELANIAREYIPEFREVLPMAEYIRFLEDYERDHYINRGLPSPLDLKAFRKENPNGNSCFTRKGIRFFIGINTRLSNEEQVWIFFHELCHLIERHHRNTSVPIARRHDSIAYQFAYEEILKRELVAKKDLKKFQSFYWFLQVREKCRKRWRVFDRNDMLAAERITKQIEKNPSEFAKYYL